METRAPQTTSDDAVPARQLRPRRSLQRSDAVCPVCRRHVSPSTGHRMQTRRQHSQCTCEASAAAAGGGVAKGPRTLTGRGAESVRKRRPPRGRGRGPPASRARSRHKALPVVRARPRSPGGGDDVPGKERKPSLPPVESGSDKPGVSGSSASVSVSGEESADRKPLSVDLFIASSLSRLRGRPTLPASQAPRGRSAKEMKPVEPAVSVEPPSYLDSSSSSKSSTPRDEPLRDTPGRQEARGVVVQTRAKQGSSARGTAGLYSWSSSSSSSSGITSAVCISLRSGHVMRDEPRAGSGDMYSNPVPSTSGLGARRTQFAGGDDPTPQASARHGPWSGRSMDEGQKRMSSYYKAKKHSKDEESRRRKFVESAVSSSHTEIVRTPEIALAIRKTKIKHVCPVCSKAFGSPGKLRQHMYSHTGERPFQCSQCPKSFSSKFKLVRHVLIHSDERKFHCTICDRTFHRKDHLKNHVKVHSPVKRTFRCEKEGCGKEYSSFLSFRKHLAVHAAEEGNLECKMCGKTFATKEEIVYHLKVHAGSRTVKNPSDKKYLCDHCDRKFFTRKDVRRHLVVHTGKRDFLCQFCPQRFGRKDHLVRHIKKSHHGGSVPKGKMKKVRTSAAVTTAPPTSGAAALRRMLSASKPSTSRDSYPEIHLLDPTPSTSTSDDLLLGYSQPVEASELVPIRPIPSYVKDEESKEFLMAGARSFPEDSLGLGRILEEEGHFVSSEGGEEVKMEPGAEEELQQGRGGQLVPGFMYVAPPPPYPGGLRQDFKLFEPSEEPKMQGHFSQHGRLSPGDGVDINQLLGLLPGASPDEGQASHLRAEEDLQGMLQGSVEGSLLGPGSSLSSQLLQLMGSSGAPEEAALPHVLSPEEQQEGQPESTPLPRFNQAFPQ
ncbi:myoneurin-like [Bacillus rossius redtenbacheri]|uniref:myoneurin-like n=1 Tax=Bacillus rossius redtenbacheri TaxID=93214 RepID=UPI002FDD2617